MAGTVLRVALAGAVVMVGAAARGDEPVLPAPRPLATKMVLPPPSFERPDPYAVWQNYAVDRRGYWRPLVAPSYDGPRYVATGDPYPWWKERPRYFEPVMANPAAFGGALPRPVLMAPPVIAAPGWERMPYAEE
ncbi:MAG TPA: hypothetical protein VFW33_14890 [Gemmataceae bacterium]|nr:hypothetical protein [Gemmataceae bacterium]